MKWESLKNVDATTVCRQINYWSKIAQISAPPIVILFGPDSALKTELESIFTDEIYGLTIRHELDGAIDLDDVNDLLANRGPVMVVLSGRTSAKHELRHGVVSVVNAATKNRSIIGIYAKARSAAPEHFKEIEALEKSPPTPDGLVELITVTED